ncbi:hypothetical protein HOF56_01310 [Candidatus Peribacteria bacterium]|nr:hypothetical protein [Candidatus Peribacteria bacterium]MBT4020803.1 hypothetical protein [Candidatus Peribacteria bacterium]MBT4241013.1 hypothetical protein [Candidatus Peribacteria bacterium]MBT4474489.1 hypothetical protein [Candidatus Peribacteria bacterium]
MNDLSGGGQGQGDDDTSAPKPAASGGDSKQYGDEIHSITIRAKQRTFYIDLKKSANGKFFKVSEKSRGGRKTTIMFDSEDLQAFIDAFSEMKGKL